MSLRVIYDMFLIICTEWCTAISESTVGFYDNVLDTHNRTRLFAASVEDQASVVPTELDGVVDIRRTCRQTRVDRPEYIAKHGLGA